MFYRSKSQDKILLHAKHLSTTEITIAVNTETFQTLKFDNFCTARPHTITSMQLELEGASAIGSVGADFPDNYQTVPLLTQLPRELRNEIYKHVFFPAAKGTSNEERECFDSIPRSQYQILPFHVHDSHDGWRLLHCLG